MTYIVEPEKEELVLEALRTMCVLCSEDPRWCE
jgi:hypothetical protein